MIKQVSEKFAAGIPRLKKKRYRKSYVSWGIGTIDIKILRQRTLDFIEKCKIPSKDVGEYRYSTSVAKPTLYSSTYAAMVRSLYNDLDKLTEAQRTEWIQYFNRYQDDDGLFRDPIIYGQGWYADDPFWCGRPHLTGHVITALTCLGGTAQKPIALACKFSNLDVLIRWLETRDWGERVAWTGNEIMNIGTILQYARDFHNYEPAGKAVEYLLDWLDTQWINSDTGIWGSLDISDPINRSQAVQAAYHWWTLYFYDKRPVPYIERAIDTLLATQNPEGGFGCGVHNPGDPFKSSACEDIDSIDPLVRMSAQTDYRRNDIHCALERALSWLLQNQMPDGGFVFFLDSPFQYGHPELHGEKNTGAMFPTWFRTLTIALIGKALKNSWVGKYPWNFVGCPGFHF